MVLNLLKELGGDNMSFTNPEGIKLSYECEELIEELKSDIAEFGGDRIVAVWCLDNSGVTFYTNYDFIVAEDPLDETELQPGEYISKMSMSALLILLEKQNEIL